MKHFTFATALCFVSALLAPSVTFALEASDVYCNEAALVNSYFYSSLAVRKTCPGEPTPSKEEGVCSMQLNCAFFNDVNKKEISAWKNKPFEEISDEDKKAFLFSAFGYFTPQEKTKITAQYGKSFDEISIAEKNIFLKANRPTRRPSVEILPSLITCRALPAKTRVPTAGGLVEMPGCPPPQKCKDDLSAYTTPAMIVQPELNEVLQRYNSGTSEIFNFGEKAK